MIEPRLRHVFEAMARYDVACLLMGGQACVLYGAAEFSKDIDFVILANQANLKRTKSALDSLRAEVIAVPPFEASYLEMGLAIHFRCKSSPAEGLRVDLMTKLRGVDTFQELWNRRTTLRDESGTEIHILGVEDLVAAKKTQRDKDWPMIQRLLEVHYFENAAEPNVDHVRFWLQESRTPEILIDLAERFPEIADEIVARRPALSPAISGKRNSLDHALHEEMSAEKEADRAYWEPLKEKLGDLRAERRRES